MSFEIDTKKSVFLAAMAVNESYTAIFGPEFEGWTLEKMWVSRNNSTTDNPSKNITLVQTSGTTVLQSVNVSGLAINDMHEISVNVVIPSMGGDPGQLRFEGANFFYRLFKLTPPA